jgi:hypothetical protein
MGDGASLVVPLSLFSAGDEELEEQPTTPTNRETERSRRATLGSQARTTHRAEAAISCEKLRISAGRGPVQGRTWTGPPSGPSGVSGEASGIGVGPTGIRVTEPGIVDTGRSQGL